MNLGRREFLEVVGVAVAGFVLSRCGPDKNPSVSAVTPTSTRTPTTTATHTPTTTATHTPTFTPTRESTPTPDILTQAIKTPEDFASITKDNFENFFIHVTDEQSKKLTKNILNGTDAKLSTDDSVHPAIVYGADGIAVYIHGEMRVNMIPRYAISQQLQSGVAHLVKWEVIVQDPVTKKNKRECLTVAFEQMYARNDIYYGESDFGQTIFHLNHTAVLSTIEMRLITRTGYSKPEYLNPVYYQLASGTDPVRENLKKGIIDDATGDEPIVIRGYNN